MLNEVLETFQGNIIVLYVPKQTQTIPNSSIYSETNPNNPKTIMHQEYPYSSICSETNPNNPTIFIL